MSLSNGTWNPRENPKTSNPIPTTTEQSTTDRLTDRFPLTRCRLSLFPESTKLAGPVVILQAGKPRPTVLLSNKLIFPDGSEVVVGVPCRALWQGADGAAFDADPKTVWRIAASVRNGIIFNHANIR